MVARDTAEAERAATPFELFFDTSLVAAAAAASNHRHLAVADGHAGSAIVSYVLVSFSIWWAWMNFSWFSSAYDNDDVVYRLCTLVQITGVLILAAGVPRAFDSRDFDVVFLGYRAAHHSDVSSAYAGAAVTIPAAIYIVMISSPRDWWRR